MPAKARPRCCSKQRSLAEAGNRRAMRFTGCGACWTPAGFVLRDGRFRSRPHGQCRGARSGLCCHPSAWSPKSEAEATAVRAFLAQQGRSLSPAPAYASRTLPQAWPGSAFDQQGDPQEPKRSTRWGNPAAIQGWAELASQPEYNPVKEESQNEPEPDVIEQYCFRSGNPVWRNSQPSLRKSIYETRRKQQTAAASTEINRAVGRPGKTGRPGRVPRIGGWAGACPP